jgi:hypothetical protein
MMHQTTVVVGGTRYSVTYDGRGFVHRVAQQIVPMRTAIYWRALNPSSKAFKAAVEAANRKKAQEAP